MLSLDEHDFFITCHFQFCNHLPEEERAGCSASIVILLLCGCQSSVSLSRGAMSWSIGLWSVIVAFPGQTHFLWA